MATFSLFVAAAAIQHELCGGV